MAYFQKTATGRLKMPKMDQRVYHKGDKDIPEIKVGDFVYMGGKSVSAGNIGKIVKLENHGTNGKYAGHFVPPNDWHATAEMLDGTEDGTWFYAIAVIPESAVQEVKDFYINDGRSERIKVTW
jgi:hypothetical protein